MITQNQVIEAQNEWGQGVVKIGALNDNRVESKKYANQFLKERYAFNNGPVLFKPTKCEIEQFRGTQSKALSYFIAVMIEPVMKIKVLQYSLGQKLDLKIQR